MNKEIQSTFYLFPGQTEENTKVEDRGKALLCTEEGWGQLTSHLDRVKKQEALLEEERARRQYLKEGSYNMVKDWDNSIEKIRQRRIAEHENKKRALEEDRMTRFLQLRKEQELERQQFVLKAKKKLFMHQEKPRGLNSALLLTEVMHERKLQQQFNDRELEHQQIEEAKYAALVKYNAEQEKIEKAQKAKETREKNIKHSIELKEQLKEIQELNKKEYDERIATEKIDNMRAAEEIQAIKQYEFNVATEKKKDVMKQFHEFRVVQQKYKEELQKQDEAEDKIVKIYDKAKCRIENTKKRREKEAKDEQNRIRDKIAARVMAQMKGNEELEQRILERAQKEHEEHEQEVLRAKAAYQQQLREDRDEYKRQYEERKKKHEHENEQLEKWKLLNRLKVNEVITKHNHEKEQKAFDEKIAYRRELFKQMDDLQRLNKYEKECEVLDFKLHKEKLKKDDAEFFAYGDEVKELAKSRGRSTEPIQKVIEKYKVDNELVMKKKNRTCLESKVPINNDNI